MLKVFNVKLPESLNINTTLLEADTIKWTLSDYGSSHDERNIDSNIRNTFKADVNWLEMFPSFSQELRKLLTDNLKIKGVVLKDFEIIKYDTGSFFSNHLDRHRGAGHLGTLLLIYPSADLVGGSLKVNGKIIKVEQEGEAQVGVGEQSIPTPTPTPMIVYIPLGLYHEVDRITAGHRYVLKSAVFHPEPKPLVRYNAQHLMDPITRIIVKTGLRMPTDEEIERLQNPRYPYRWGIVRNNAIMQALGETSKMAFD